MSGGTGYPTTLSGTATTTEAPVAIVSPWRKGYPNQNGTAPTPKARATYLRETRISNNDGTNSLLVRINGATAVTTLGPGETLLLAKAIIYSLSVKSSASSVAFDVVGVAA